MRAFAALLLVLSVGFAAPAGAEELRPKLDDLLRHFANVVFGDEYGLSTTPKVIAKWSGPVGVIVQGRPTQEMADMAGKHLGTLARLTKLKFKQIKPGTPGPSIDLIFLKRKNMAAIRGPNLDPKVIQTLTNDPTMVCFFLKWHSPAERIVKAIIAVNIERDPASINACLLEELTQVMGLPNDVDAYWPTIFQPVDRSTQLSQWDELYVKALYDPRMRPGMKPVDALVVAKGIFEEALAKQP